jgi:hypothetical protein
MSLAAGPGPAASRRSAAGPIGAVERAGSKDLNERQKINYEVQAERGRVAAVNLKGLLLMNVQCRILTGYWRPL